MSTEPRNPHQDTSEQVDTTSSEAKPSDQPSSQWRQVVREHKAVVKDLNRDAVSFTMPSAEGITMYRGIDGHSGNGNMRKLARKGLQTLVRQIHQERAASSEESSGDGDGDESVADPPVQGASLVDRAESVG